MPSNQTFPGPVFRPETNYPYLHHEYTDVEKRRLFLRSYQFSTNKSATASLKIKRVFFRVRRVIWVRIRSVKKIRKMLWFRIKHGLVLGFRKRTRFFRIIRNNNHSNFGNGKIRSWTPSFFW